jgi:putative GTP pyrophosphokinase
MADEQEPKPGNDASDGEEPKRARERESTPPAASREVGSQPFDFPAHRRNAVERYSRVRDRYERFATVVRNILRAALEREGIQVLSVDSRAKSTDSFGDKAASRSEADPTRPKYPRPLEEITDMAGVRVVAFFPKSIDQVCRCVDQEFQIVERVDLREPLLEKDQFGYQSVHYIVTLTDQRVPLPEYDQYRGMRAEIQVRTILQHAWAEIEHGIQYKSTITLPTEIHRRLLSLAGLLEVADREFERVKEIDGQLRRVAATNIDKGEELDQVEITPDALKLYLDKRLRPDARMAGYSYDFEARRLRMLGFRTFAQVDECVRDLDDDKISRVLAGGRLGQITRFGYLLLAGMGDEYIRRMRNAQPSYPDDWWEFVEKRLRSLRESGIPVGHYSPPIKRSSDEIAKE